MSTFQLEIVTPVGKTFEGEATYVLVRTVDGDMGILPNHAPFVSALQPNEIKINLSKEKEVRYYISNGFLEINNNKVVIIVDEAMLPEEIDLEKARKEVLLAQEKMKKVTEEAQMMLTEKTLREALVKVKIGERLL